MARLRFLLSDQTLAATCCYAIKIPMIPHIALEGLVFCRMMFRNVVGWPAVAKAGNGGPVTFLCQQFCVGGDICRIVSDPSLSINDAPKINELQSQHVGYPVISLSERKFVALVSSKQQCDAIGCSDGKLIVSAATRHHVSVTVIT